MNSIPEITVEALISQYEVLLFDAYGVLVHNAGALPGAAALIERLNQIGKAYYILTNDASKLPTTAAARYQEYGLALAPERIITSGLLLRNHFATQGLGGARCAVLGPADSLQYVEQAGGRVVAAEEMFDVLVIGDESGFPFLDTVDAAISTLFRALDRQQEVHLVVPNPDLIYPKADQGFGIASGSLALMFEAALHLRYPHRPELRFTRLGKPHGAIFAEAQQRSGSRDMVMIGDQLATDIRGARAFGLDAVLISTGVTAAVLTDMAADLRPTYRMAAL